MTGHGVVTAPGPWRCALAAGPVLLVALALYVRTLLPDVGTWDTAELQAIGPVLGIAHPTGFPTYTLLAWLASVLLQPFGNEAYRADLLSALLVAGAAALLATAAVQATRRWPLGLAAGIAFAVSPIAWFVGTRADAHALHAFFAALLLVLLVAWQHRQRRGETSAGRWLLLAAIVYGLSLGNHALTLLMAPGIAAFVLLVAPRILWQQWRLVVACAVALAVTTVAVYAYLPIRSAMDPPLDYADPETWEGFWYLVLGRQFQGSFGAISSVPDLLAGMWDQLVRDLGLVAVLVPAGALLGALRHPRLIVLTSLWFAATWVFAMGYPNAAIERYYLVPLMAACLWLALAVDVAVDALTAPLVRLHGRATELVASVVAVVLVALTLSAVPDRLGRLDASGDRHGREWLEATLATLAPDAVVVSWWSYSTPLWYGRWVEGRRDDITILDDRDIIDDGYAGAEDAIDRFLDQRPVYVLRLARDLPRLAARYDLELVPGIPSPGDVYRVRGRAMPAPGEPDP